MAMTMAVFAAAAADMTLGFLSAIFGWGMNEDAIAIDGEIKTFAALEKNLLRCNGAA